MWNRHPVNNQIFIDPRALALLIVTSNIKYYSLLHRRRAILTVTCSIVCVCVYRLEQSLLLGTKSGSLVLATTGCPQALKDSFHGIAMETIQLTPNTHLVSTLQLIWEEKGAFVSHWRLEVLYAETKLTLRLGHCEEETYVAVYKMKHEAVSHWCKLSHYTYGGLCLTL